MNKAIINGRNIVQHRDKIVIDGEDIMLPEYVRSKSMSMRIIGNRITINGYKLDLKTKSFSKSRFNFCKFLGL